MALTLQGKSAPALATSACAKPSLDHPMINTFRAGATVTIFRLLRALRVQCSVGATPDAPAAAYTVDFRGSSVSDVHCGDYHTCVLLDKGSANATVKCFGDNSVYQLVSNTGSAFIVICTAL
jgi:Regulator of chromosome condensation (RCC1) repeat